MSRPGRQQRGVAGCAIITTSENHTIRVFFMEIGIIRGLCLARQADLDERVMILDSDWLEINTFIHV
jgi:hypothetical protein